MKKLGFGCMRLPMTEQNQVDLPQFSKMIDVYFENGFNYFDTAHGYINGKSETAIRECLAKRYPREKYILTNKLSGMFFKCEQDILPLFEQQLEATGVQYFDYYLIHAITKTLYKKYVDCNVFEVLKKLKAQGKIKHIGMSFHDKAEVLEQILSERPEIEVVQIQFNYVDFDDSSVESRACYEVCRKYNKPVLIMEPVKGGALANLPPDAEKILTDLNGGSVASYAVRFAASFDGVMMVLSGMSDLEQMQDNISYMKDFVPLNQREIQAVDEVRKIFHSLNLIPCTACRYCIEDCPKQIPIADIFACFNSQKKFKDWNSGMYYNISTTGKGKATDCIKCGKCENICPQHLHIRDLLMQVGEIFEKKA